MDQKAGKVAGHRTVPERVSFQSALTWQTTASTLFGPRPICTRGVFRFRSFAEAHEWMIEQAVARSPGARPPRTSSGSPGR